MHDPIWQEFIVENKVLLEKLFASNGWKKALLPWLKAQKNLKIRTVLTTQDHIKSDTAKGIVLAFEQIISLPEAIAAFEKMPKTEERPVQQDSTFAADGVLFEEEID